MPAFVNNKVGSFLTTMAEDGTMLCPLEAKKSKNFFLISLEFIISTNIFVFIISLFHIAGAKPASVGN